MSTPLDDRRRIEDLERIAGELRQAVRTAWTTRDRVPKHIRIAITAAADGVTYPTAPCNVYPIKFLDATATGTQGVQAITSAERTNTRVHYASTISPGLYLEEGTMIAVFWDRGVNWSPTEVEWWILDSYEGVPRKAGFVAGTLLTPRFTYGPDYLPGDYTPPVDGIHEVQVASGNWWGTQQDVDDPRDGSGRVQVQFKAWEYPFAPAGAWGVYVLDRVADIYRPVVVDQMALMIRFELLNPICGTITPSQPGAIGESFQAMTPYPFSSYPDGLTIDIPIANSMAHQAKAGEIMFARLDASANQYEIDDAPGKDITCFTDLRLLRESSGSCAKVQGKRITFRAESCEETAPTWVDTSIRMETLDVVTNVELVSTPYVPEVPADPGPYSPAVPATCVVKRTRASVCVLSNEVTTLTDGEITGYSAGYTPTVGTVFSFQSTPVMVDAGETTDELYGTLAYVWTGPCDPEFEDADFTIATIGECPEE